MKNRKPLVKQKLPSGWTEASIRRLAEFYDNQTEDEQLAEYQAACARADQTVMSIPNDLVPAVRKLLARHEDDNHKQRRATRRASKA